MQTEEEKIKQFLKGNNLINIWFNALLRDNSYTGSHTSLSRSHSERLKTFKMALAEANVPEKDITYWAEKLLLYFEYRLEKELPGGDMHSDENFRQYQEKAKHDNTKLYLGITLFILAVVVLAVIFG